MRILCFGDSITASLSNVAGGWVTLLSQSLFQEDDVDIYNLGVSGDTATTLLKRLEAETSARIWKDTELLLLIFIGINDSAIGSDYQSSTPEKYEEQLIDIIKIAKKFSEKIFFISLLPVDDTQLNPIPWEPESKIAYKTKRVHEFDTVLRMVADRNQVKLIDIWHMFKNREKELTTDGIHPNNAGHEIIAQLVENKLRER